jgi:hypothetical protein
MWTKRIRNAVLVTVMVVSLAVSGRADPPQMKMTTTMPPGIASPDKVEILYDSQARSMVQTDQHFPSPSSQQDDLVVNADGSVDIHFGPKAPGHQANWIQTVPGKGWNTILRLYSPLEPWFDKTRRPGEIEEVQ